MPAIIGVSSICYGPYGWPAALEHLPQLGLSRLQVSIETGNQPAWRVAPVFLSHTDTLTVAQQRRQICQSAGIEIRSCQISTGNPAIRTVREILRKKIALAAGLGAAEVMGDAGEANSEDELTQVYAGLQDLADLCQSFGMTYCLQIAPGLGANHRYLAKVIHDLNHPALAINFDPAALIYWNDFVVTEVSLSKICHLVKHVQLRDCYGQRGDENFPALGYGGAVDFLRIHQIFKDLNYPAPLVITVDGLESDPEDLPLSEYRKRLADSCQTLRQCGFRWGQDVK